MRSSSLILSEFLLTNLKAEATRGTSSFVRIEHFSASFVLELPMVYGSVLWFSTLLYVWPTI